MVGISLCHKEYPTRTVDIMPVRQAGCTIDWRRNVNLEYLDRGMAVDRPTQGQHIQIDDGAMYQLRNCTDWDEASFRVSTCLCMLACNVEVTGRTVQFHGWQPRMRCRVEFVGDCEPSTFCRGWLYLIPVQLEHRLS